MNKLSRKNFLVRSGIILTVPAFLEYCASSSDARLAGKSGDDPLENANSEKYEEPILKAINVGITAPNPHNTQPWKFKILNSTEMHLYVDEKRILSITDVPSRQIHIGQGTFLELLKIGAKQIGYDTEIKLLPDGDYKLEEIGKKPVAKIKLSARWRFKMLEFLSIISVFIAISLKTIGTYIQLLGNPASVVHPVQKNL